ncbi:hypothetical protein P7K49_028647, partial [Saguinus oedipus]
QSRGGRNVGALAPPERGGIFLRARKPPRAAREKTAASRPGPVSERAVRAHAWRRDAADLRAPGPARPQPRVARRAWKTLARFQDSHLATLQSRSPPHPSIHCSRLLF